MNSGFLKLYLLWQRIAARLFSMLIGGALAGKGKGTVIMPPLRIGGAARIYLGSDVFVGPGSWLQVLASAPASSDPVISIGDGVAVSGYCTITAVNSVVIERKVLMARYVYISDHSHAHGSRGLPIQDQGITSGIPVRIKEGAWLGQNVVVCPGVTIGRNSVIGANSVVRHDVPDFAVAVGAPARVIRMIDEVKRA